MRKVLLFISVLLFCFGCTSKKESLYPNIKVCKVYSSEFEIMNSEIPGLLIQEFRFNKDGHVRELIRFDIQGNIVGRFDIMGEDSPFPVPLETPFIDTTITDIQYGLMGDVRKKETNIYDINGRLIEVLEYDMNDKLKHKNTYQYNNQGYISSDTYWDVELNAPMQVIKYRYEYFQKPEK